MDSDQDVVSQNRPGRTPDALQWPDRPCRCRVAQACLIQQPDRHNYCLNTVPQAPCTATGSDVIVSPRSYHPGGVNIAMVDGSIRFVTDDVDARTYKAAGSRNGEEAYKL